MANTPVSFLVRRDTSTNWSTANPVLKLGEIGYETDTRRLKIGTGGVAWAALGYVSATVGAITDVPGLVTALSAKQNTDSLAPLALSGSAADLSAGVVPNARLASLLQSVAALSLSGNAGKTIVVNGAETGFTLATPTVVDTTAPIITSASTATVPENSPFSLTLTANEAVTWSKVGGADTALFTLAANVLTMAAKNYEIPTDSDTNNTYVVQVRATDGAGNFTNQTITVTVTDVSEGSLTTDTSMAPLFISLNGTRDTTPLSIDVEAGDYQVGQGYIKVRLYADATLATYTDVDYTPTDANITATAPRTVSIGLTSITGTKRIAAFWVNTSANTISPTSNLLLWGPNDVAPVLSGASSFSTITFSSATSTVLTDTSGGTVYAVYTLTNSAPSAIQVEAGQNAAGTSAAYAGNRPGATTAPVSFTSTGLSATTVYYVWYMHKPAVGPRSTVLSGGSVTTAAAPVSTSWELLTATPLEYRGGYTSPVQFTGQNIGTADTNREIVALVQVGNEFAFDTCKVGGITLTRVFAGTALQIFKGLVPTGTSATVEVLSTASPGSNCNNVTVTLFRATGYTSSNSSSFAYGFYSPPGEVVSVAATTSSGALTMFCGYSQVAAADPTFAAATRDNKSNTAWEGTRCFVSGHRTTTSSAAIVMGNVSTGSFYEMAQITLVP